jgi:pyridoxine 5-phosphate synthase
MNLGVNIDHIATIRELRKGKTPDLVQAAKIVLSARANSIVVHLREDRRHIQESDLINLRKALKCKLNLEMSLNKDIVDIACKIKPDQATLVPEKRKELTTEGGLNVVGELSRIKKTVRILESKGIQTSLFVDPNFKQIKAAKETKAEFVELHTGEYANSKTKSELRKHLNEIKDAVFFARNLGLKVNAGHGLDYSNVLPVARINGIEELNIGYSIICMSIMVGLKNAVKDMLKLIN